MATKTPDRVSRLLLSAFTALIMLFLLAPILSVTFGALTKSTFVVFPPHGITFKWYIGIFHQPDFLTSLGLSCEVALIAASIGTLMGLMVAIALIRFPSRLNSVLWVVVLSPVMFPTIVLGLAFLDFYGKLGLGNSPWALIGGHVIIVTPFATSLAVIGLQTANPQYELAARNLGATPWRSFRYITFPLVKWSLIAGWALSFMISFGDLSVSLFLASPGLTTLPVRIFDSLEFTPLNPSLTAISSGLVLIALIVLVGASRMVKLEKLFGSK